MPKFRRKPVVVDAEQLSEVLRQAKTRWHKLPDWVREAYEDGKIIFAPNILFIKTIEGEMRGESGDWLLNGVQGEIYPCKPEIFSATYESADFEATLVNALLVAAHYTSI